MCTTQLVTSLANGRKQAAAAAHRSLFSIFSFYEIDDDTWIPRLLSKQIWLRRRRSSGSSWSSLAIHHRAGLVGPIIDLANFVSDLLLATKSCCCSPPQYLLPFQLEWSQFFRSRYWGFQFLQDAMKRKCLFSDFCLLSIEYIFIWWWTGFFFFPFCVKKQKRERRRYSPFPSFLSMRTTFVRLHPPRLAACLPACWLACFIYIFCCLALASLVRHWNVVVSFLPLGPRIDNVCSTAATFNAYAIHKKQARVDYILHVLCW